MEKLYKHPIIQYSILGTGGLLLLGCVLFFALSGNAKPSAEELTELALTGLGPAEREQAAAALAAHPDAGVEHLRKVWRDSSDVSVRAAVVMALGTRRDWESIPEMVAALDDPSVLLRGRSAQAINLVVGEDFGFEADVPEDQRQQVIDVINAKWPVLHEGYLAKQRLQKANATPEVWEQTRSSRQGS